MSEYINNIVYGIKSFVTGMKLTWKHFANKKELAATLQYPHEKWPVPERGIGFEHSDYNLIVSNIHEILSEGHMIELHIHPHWLDACFNQEKNTWDLY